MKTFWVVGALAVWFTAGFVVGLKSGRADLAQAIIASGSYCQDADGSVWPTRRMAGGAECVNKESSE